MDCYGDAEAEGSLHVYLSEAPDYPFEAKWRGTEETQQVTLLALSDNWKSSRGLMFQALVNGRKRASGPMKSLRSSPPAASLPCWMTIAPGGHIRSMKSILKKMTMKRSECARSNAHGETR